MDEQRAVQFVKVKNGNSFTIKDLFDGVPYTFLAGKTETIPADAAEHMFGYTENCDMEKLYHFMVQRHGWNTYKVKDEDAREYVNKFSFTPVAARLVMETTDSGTVSTSDPAPEPETFNEVPPRKKRPAAIFDNVALAVAPESE
jgi:hypothetical protein